MGVLEALGEVGIDVPINVEVFSGELRRLSPAEAAAALVTKVQGLLEGNR